MAKKKVTKKKSRPTASRATTKRAAKKDVTKKKIAKKQRARDRSTTRASKKTTAAKKKVQKKKPATKQSTARLTKKTTTKAASTPATPPGAKKSSSRRRSAKTVGTRKRSGSVAEAASAALADAQGYVFINGRRVRMISTKKKVDGSVKKPRSAVVQRVPIESEPIPREADKPIKSKLAPKTLDEYRNLLLIKRGELVGDLSAMEAEALQSSSGNLSHVPIHMADMGTDTYDQDFMLGLAEKERSRLREIDAALTRIEDRTYGVCQMTGKSIPRARLLAKPWAKYTIEAAREVEGSWGS